MSDWTIELMNEHINLELRRLASEELNKLTKEELVNLIVTGMHSGSLKVSTPIDSELVGMLQEDNASILDAGFNMAKAASRVVRKYDGLHRLSLAISEWYKAVADQGNRSKKERK